MSTARQDLRSAAGFVGVVACSATSVAGAIGIIAACVHFGPLALVLLPVLGFWVLGCVFAAMRILNWATEPVNE